MLKTAAQGKVLENVTLSTLAPASNKNVEKPRTKMAITTRKDYPLRDSFPLSLEKLLISNCRLKRIDTRIFSLKKLEVLDLRENVIEKLPNELSGFPNLRELVVCNNQLTNFPASLCVNGNFRNSLCLMDVSHNQIEALPPQICELDSLVSLKVDYNRLETLPHTIGRMKKLRFLSATMNKMKTLPASFMQLRLETLHLFANQFVDGKEECSNDSWEPPTLVECCARMIRKYK